MLIQSTIIFAICAASCFRDTSAVDCVTTPCDNGGTCENSICICDTTQYAGDTCAHTCDPVCTPGTDICQSDGSTAACAACPTGPACTVYEECVPGALAPECACRDGLSGDGCATIDCSLGNPCLSGGTCVTGSDPDTCRCAALTHSGDICQNECTTACVAPKVCSGAGTCQDCATTCTEPYEECVSGVATPVCSCKLGLSGANCTTVACADGNPCLNGGTCTNNACTCDTTLAAGDICQLACTGGCAEGQTCEENAGVGTCSGGQTILASIALILAAVARRLF